jgi:hypothetical protein
MNEKPILFSPEMVRAILDGRKTQTRRVIREIKNREGMPVHFSIDENGWPVLDWSWEKMKCPYGVPGDRLWVRETYQLIDNIHGGLTTLYKADDNSRKYTEEFLARMKWQSPIFMPRMWSRITLEVVNVRVERVQEIGEEDAIKEGANCPPYTVFPQLYKDEQDYLAQGGFIYVAEDATRYGPTGKFACLWDKINAKRGYAWSSNPWVWVIEFKRVSQ